MKTSILAGGLAAMALVATGGATLAQQPGGTAGSRHARADVNGDGRISQAEFVQRRVERLTASDTNGDGTVSVEERRAGMQAHRAARSSERFSRLDADGNGSVSRSEFDAAHTARAGQAGHGPRAGRTDGHRAGGRAGHAAGMAGQGSAGGSVVIAEARARAIESFARLDTNHDGYLTAEEGRAGRQQMREQRREHMTERGAARQARRQTSPASSPSE